MYIICIYMYDRCARCGAMAASVVSASKKQSSKHRFNSIYINVWWFGSENTAILLV